MSHLPPKPEFEYPARYPPPDPRHYPRPPIPPPGYPPALEHYPPRERHAYPPRSPPRVRGPPVDSYIPGRTGDPYRARPLPPPMHTYVPGYHDTREDDRYREHGWDRRGDEYRDRDRGRERRWEDDARRAYEGERRERVSAPREEDRDRFRPREEDRDREWQRSRDVDRERREYPRLRTAEEVQYMRDRAREVAPERKWVSRTSRSPPRRMAPAKAPERSEQSPLPPSRPRSPSPSRPRTHATPAPVASRPASPYRVERSRPLRSRSPPVSNEVKLGNHSISVSRTPARTRRDFSPQESDRRRPSPRRSRTPDRTRREIRRDPSRSRAGRSDYRVRDRRSPPRRRSYTPVSPARRKSPPRTSRRRTPSPPSRSRSRSPTRTPPPKRHVLPPLKSPSRPPPPPPPTGPRIRAVLQQPPVQQPAPDTDGDIKMEDATTEDVPASAPAELATETTSTVDVSTDPAPASVHPASPILASDPLPTPAVLPPTVVVETTTAALGVPSVSPSPSAAALASPSTSSVNATPNVPSLSMKTEPEPERKPPIHPRRRSRSPPRGPRHDVVTPANRSPAQTGPNLPAKPEWGRRITAHSSHQSVKVAETPAPVAAPEHTGFQPVIPPYPVKPSVTADLEAEVARLRSLRMHQETEYVEIAKATRKALNELMIAELDLKAAEGRRAITSALFEKARLGSLGVDYIVDPQPLDS